MVIKVPMDIGNTHTLVVMDIKSCSISKAAPIKGPLITRKTFIYSSAS